VADREDKVAPKAKAKYRITVNHNYCTGCGNCVEYCPMHVLEKDSKLNKRGVYAPVAHDIDNCTGCKLCELYCGNFSIAVGTRLNPDEEGVV
jgi:2-oxoglutarate ferredoxin oxidoreductase subunit delta